MLREFDFTRLTRRPFWRGWAGAVLIFCAASASAVPTNNAALWRPRFATPALVSLDKPANRAFTAEVKASAAATNWSASLANDLKTWPCQILSASYATINNGAEPGWRVGLGVPADASPELFALTVACSESVSVQPQAVSAAPAFATNFYILHITDEQIVNKITLIPRGSITKWWGPGRK